MSKPSARALIADIRAPSTRANLGIQVEIGFALAARVEAVLALHSVGDVGLPPSAKPRCRSCREHYPCATRRRLDGEEA